MGWDHICFPFIPKTNLQQLLFLSHTRGNGSSGIACISVLNENKNVHFHYEGTVYTNKIYFGSGAELIEELMQKQIRQQEEEEKEVLEKIKMKMDRIKATHDRRKKGPQNHFDGMFFQTYNLVFIIKCLTDYDCIKSKIVPSLNIKYV